MKQQNKTLRTLTQGGAVAAAYVLLTLISALFGLDKGAVQLRLSEALTILPCFFPAAVPGLVVGCLLANIVTGAVLWDIVAGSLATLVGAIGTRLLRKNRWLACLSPIVANIVIITPVLMFAYGLPGGFFLLGAGVGAGEVLSCGVLGQVLYSALDKRRDSLDFLK